MTDKLSPPAMEPLSEIAWPMTPEKLANIRGDAVAEAIYDLKGAKSGLDAAKKEWTTDVSTYVQSTGEERACILERSAAHSKVEFPAIFVGQALRRLEQFRQEQARRAASVSLPGGEREAIADAIAKAEFSWSMSLTRLVDGEHTYELRIEGEPTREFSDIDDLYAVVAAHQRKVQADAVLAALSAPPPPAAEPLSAKDRRWLKRALEYAVPAGHCGESASEATERGRMEDANTRILAFVDRTAPQPGGAEADDACSYCAMTEVARANGFEDITDAITVARLSREKLGETEAKELREVLEPAQTLILARDARNAAVIYGVHDRDFLIQLLAERDAILRKARLLAPPLGDAREDER